MHSLARARARALSGPAVKLSAQLDCGGLILVSPYTSVKDMVLMCTRTRTCVHICCADVCGRGHEYKCLCVMR
jgi:hypothetical protein